MSKSRPYLRNRGIYAIAVAASFAMLLAGCGGGGGSGGTRPTTGSMPPSSTGTGLTSLNSADRGYTATAAGRAADARPRSGSVTQSSNTNNGITLDRVSVTAQHGGASGISYSVSNRSGSSWSISTSDGNPVAIDAPDPFDGQELYKSTNGGTLYVDVYSDIKAPEMRTESVPGTGTPVEISEGDTIEGLTLAEINARMGDGTLNGTAGVFSCDRSGGGNCPAFFGFFPIGTDWRFTPHESGTTRTVSTPDTDYLAGGVWVLIPDSPTSADDVVVGAFADGSDPFQQSNLMALQGTASYNGGAAGAYVNSSGENAGVGYWSGAAVLTADFGTQSDLGSISGNVTDLGLDEVNGVDQDVALSGSLNLGTAAIGSSNSGFFEGRLSGTVGGVDYSGRWGGQFFGNSEADGKPGSVGGTLGGRSQDRTTSFVGVFGAQK